MGFELHHPISHWGGVLPLQPFMWIPRSWWTSLPPHPCVVSRSLFASKVFFDNCLCTWVTEWDQKQSCTWWGRKASQRIHRGLASHALDQHVGIQGEDNAVKKKNVVGFCVKCGHSSSFLASLSPLKHHPGVSRPEGGPSHCIVVTAGGVQDSLATRLPLRNCGAASLGDSEPGSWPASVTSSFRFSPYWSANVVQWENTLWSNCSAQRDNRPRII